MSDNKTGTKRALGLIIVIIMFFSIIGSAIFYIGDSQQTQQPQDQNVVQIPIVNENELTQDKKVFVLRTGRVLLEYFYPNGCIDCIEKQALLKGFANQFQNSVVLELIQGSNQTRLQMIDQRGSIIPLEENITAESIFSSFCANS